MTRHCQFMTFEWSKGQHIRNVIFDLVIPYGKDYEPEKIVKDLKKKIKDEMQGKHYAVIRVDRF